MSVKCERWKSNRFPFCTASVMQSTSLLGNACLGFWFSYKSCMLEITRIPCKNPVLANVLC